jgi:hypothetical protein
LQARNSFHGGKLSNRQIRCRPEWSLALTRLARAGKIEKHEENTTIPRYRNRAAGAVFKIEFYRRLQ